MDILVELSEASHIRPQELRVFSAEHCRALDLFVAEGGKAVSCANESHVRADSFPEPVARLDAVCFWNRAKGQLSADINWEFRLPIGINFALTALTTLEPLASGWLPSFGAHTKEVEASGLPVRPYLGSNLLEVGSFLVKTLRNVVAATNDLNPRGTGWTIAFKTEYRIKPSEPTR